MTAKPINESTLLFVIKLLKADVLDGKTVTRAGISTMPAKAENSKNDHYPNSRQNVL